MSTGVLDWWTRHYGVVQKSDAQTGAQTNRVLYPIITKHLVPTSIEPTDEYAQWVMIRCVVNLTGAGTFVFTDGATAVGMVHQIPANTDVEIEGPLRIGLGKALAYTTTGAFNVQLDCWASELHQSTAKPAKASGT